MTQLLGIDIGTTSVKVGVFDARGQLATRSVEYQLLHPEPGWAEVDADAWWRATVDAMASLRDADGVRLGDVVAVAVSSQGESVVPVDAQGRPIANALVWLDQRADAEAHELAERFPREVVYAHTGIPAIDATWTAAKVLWWRRRRPDVFEAAAAFVLAGDYVIGRLAGRFATCGSLACTSLLFDITTGDWWPDALTAVGLTPDRLPAIVPDGAVVGPLLPVPAEALGLTPGIPVVAGGMDQGVGAVGVGNLAPGVISESTGGALTVQASVGRPDGDPSGLTPVYVHSAPGSYLYCPVCPTGGMALTWFRDQFGGPLDFDDLTALAAQVPAGSDGLTMLPHLAGAFSPEYDPAARGVFAGFTLAHTRGHFVRAVLESIAFMLRRNVELLAGAGAGASEIRSHGGGSRSPLWNQIKADVCGVPVLTMHGADAAVRGDAMLAGVASGVFADLGEAERALVVRGQTYAPDPARKPAYDDAYHRYCRLFDATATYFNAT